MQFAIIGLGVFGKTVALQLVELGNDVTGIDVREKAVDEISQSISHAVIADATDLAVLEELNIAQYGGVLVSIGEDLEASLLCVLNLLRLKVDNVWVKAKSEAHYAILQRLGVQHIVRPEHDMGVRIGQAMNYPMVLQYMPLGDDWFIIKLRIGNALMGVSLDELERQYPQVRMLSLKRDGKLSRLPDGWLTLAKDDHVVLMGQLAQLRQLARSAEETGKGVLL